VKNQYHNTFIKNVARITDDGCVLQAIIYSK